MAATRFDFEQQLMECWNVVKDIETIYEFVGDSDPDAPDYHDRTMNMLIGTAQLHEVKFQKLFSMFEDLIHKGDL